MQQLGLNFAGYDTPNQHGVFVDCERLTMPRGKSRAYAEIRTAFVEEGFLWGESAELEQEGFGSLPNTCSVKHGHVASSRSEAISRASDRIYQLCCKTKSKASTAIQAWLSEIKPI